MTWDELIEKTIEHYKIDPSARKKDKIFPQLYPDYPLPPVNQKQWAKIVDAIEFDPGTFISQLYLRVGGGFVGPGYGTM